MPVFSSDGFLQTVKSTYFADRNAEIAIVLVDNKRYKTLVVDGSKPVAGIPFMDYITPLAKDSQIQGLKEIRVARIKKAVLAQDRINFDKPNQDVIEELQKDSHHGSNMTISPTIVFSLEDDLDTFKQKCRTRNSRAFSPRSPKKLDKLQSQGTEVEYCFQVEPKRQAEVFDALISWKEQQYLRTDVPNLFAIPSTRAFLEKLLEQNILVLSAIFVAGKPIAAHAGYVYDGVFYYLIPGYDLEQRKLSAGVVLMEYMIEQSYKEGLKEFDFLLGDEEYKFYYANNYRLVGLAGEPDQLADLVLITKKCLKNILYKNEAVKGVIQQVMKARRRRGAS